MLDVCLFEVKCTNISQFCVIMKKYKLNYFQISHWFLKEGKDANRIKLVQTFSFYAKTQEENLD